MRKRLIFSIALAVLLCLSGLVHAKSAQITSYLGNTADTDIDSYHFSGKKGQKIVFKAVRDDTCPSRGKLLGLELKRMSGLSHSFFRKQWNKHPKMTVILPSDGEYKISVMEREQPSKSTYNGLYRLEAGSRSFLELQPGIDVESIGLSPDGCGGFRTNSSNLFNISDDDRDTYRFFGEAGETVKIGVSSDFSCTGGDGEAELLLKTGPGCQNSVFSHVTPLVLPGGGLFEFDLPAACFYEVTLSQAVVVLAGPSFSGTYDLNVVIPGRYMELMETTGVESPPAQLYLSYIDADGDRFGGDETACYSEGGYPKQGYVLNSDDCNDADATIYPGAPEVCNGVDDNCDGAIDEGLPAEGSWWKDADGDGYGDINEQLNNCGLPVEGYVDNSWDCDDISSWWWQYNDAWNGCMLKGDTGCTFETRYSEACHPPIKDIPFVFRDHYVDQLKDLNKDKFGYKSGMVTPGGSGHDRTRHLQSIQYFDLDYTNVNPKGDYLVVSMSDEPDNEANINIVKVNEIANKEKGPLDMVVNQTLLNEYFMNTKRRYNHPGGSQMIGEYVFIALEDFNKSLGGDEKHPDRMRPKIGVWKINRENLDDGSSYPVPEFKYLIDPYHGHPTEFNPTDGAWPSGGSYHDPFNPDVWNSKRQWWPDAIVDKNISTAAVTKLEDGSYLLAACVKEKCEHIVFLKSIPGRSLDEDPEFTYPEFTYLDEWLLSDTENDVWLKKNEPGEYDDSYWSDCAPQNMNFVVNSSDSIAGPVGAIYLTMFGIDKNVGQSCGWGNGRPRLYTYEVKMSTDSSGNPQVFMNFIRKNKIDGGDKCGTKVAGTQGTNFEAGAGFWIRPNDRNRIAVMATQHHNSCNGNSRWGITPHWFD